MKKIVIAGPYNDDIKNYLEERLSGKYIITYVTKQEEFSKVKDAEFVVLRTLYMDAEIINSMPKLKMIQRWGAGYDTVDIEAAGKNNIIVCNAPGENAPAVSEMAILLMLAVYRNIIPIHQGIRAGKWLKQDFLGRSYMICGKKVGLIGLGNIGKMVSEKVQAFGATVQYYDAFRLSSEMERDLNLTYCPMEELLKTSDIISLHVPLLDSTYHIINKDTIALMKKTAIIINTSRGGIINDQDLCEALAENRLLGAGLDCFEVEPVPVDYPLVNLPNVVLSCHAGGNTADVSVRLAQRVISNLQAFEENKVEEKYIVNRKYLV